MITNEYALKPVIIILAQSNMTVINNFLQSVMTTLKTCLILIIPLKAFVSLITYQCMYMEYLDVQFVRVILEPEPAMAAFTYLPDICMLGCILGFMKV